jgi:hypothetical protein
MITAVGGFAYWLAQFFTENLCSAQNASGGDFWEVTSASESWRNAIIVICSYSFPDWLQRIP